MEELDSGHHVAAEPPPYEVAAIKCYGCMALEEERESMPQKFRKDGIHLYFRNRRDDP